LQYSLIKSHEELKKYLKKTEEDHKLNQLELFHNEFALPLIKLQMQGLSYYEFDYADICPENLCIICGVPPNTTNEQLLKYLKDNSLPGKDLFFIKIKSEIHWVF